jgi:hypothetical protein
MNALSNGFEVRHEQGFAVHVLNNSRIELAVVPELGARIISLKDLRTMREWLWHPDSGARLFRNRTGDDFSTGPLYGIDECLPTIAPCAWQGRKLPDHGEVWTAAWFVDKSAWQTGVLRASALLPISPFIFSRTIELRENQVLLSYELENRSGHAEHYLWAMHPLLRLRPGDRLDLPISSRALLNGTMWVDEIDSANLDGNCSKVFARPITEGSAGIVNHETGDRLNFTWDTTQNDTLGLWLSCGGWHGHHHFAIEPSRGQPDDLASAADGEYCGTVPPHSSVAWQVSIHVGV